MTTPIYVFICTLSTYERAIPAQGLTQAEFQRKTALAFADITGGTTRAGDLLLRPTQDAIANHILANGAVYNRDVFPQLFEYLGATFGGDGVTTFAVPDYTNDALAVPALTVTQVVDTGGTVTTGGAVTTPTTPSETGGTEGGNVPSGGRFNRILEDRL
jgi:hypothetical protein